MKLKIKTKFMAALFDFLIISNETLTVLLSFEVYKQNHDVVRKEWERKMESDPSLLFDFTF